MSLDDLRHLSKDDLLSRLGLTTKPDMVDYLLPALGIFGAGLVIGAGLGLMLAPKPGAELREDLAERYGKVVDSLRNRLGDETEATSAAATPMRNA